MQRNYKSADLPIESVSGDDADTITQCPGCSHWSGQVLGRSGQRLVFRCSRCNVRFFNPRDSASKR